MDSLPARGYFTSTAEYNSRNWSETSLPEEIAFSDLFNITFWKHHAAKFNISDLIRVRRVDGEWDLMLAVVAKAPGGLRVEEWPKRPSQADVKAAHAEQATAIQVREINGMPVPRVEHTPRTKWRVIGLDGQELSRDHATKAHAELALKTYATTLGKEIKEIQA